MQGPGTPRKLVLRLIKGGWYVYRKFYVGARGHARPTYRHLYRGKFVRTRTTRPSYAEMEFVEVLYLRELAARPGETSSAGRGTRPTTRTRSRSGK
jgi:hypothetical protein